MIEAIVMLVALFGLGWVLLWSMIQEKVRPGQPAQGFFATKHDLYLQKKHATQDETKNGDGLTEAQENPGRAKRAFAYELVRDTRHRN